MNTENNVDQSTERTSVDANIELVVQAGALLRSGFADRDNHPFADDFVFHYFNPQLPDLAGDYHGFDGTADLFKSLAEASETGFRNVPHSLGFDGTMIDVDAVVVWRVFGGQIHEAWDIPAVNTVRPNRPSPAQTGPSRSNLTD